MKITYDAVVDVLRMLFRDVPVAESDEDKPSVILDASKRVEDPRKVEFAEAG